MSDLRTEQIRLLIQQMPDGALQTLESALSFSAADAKLNEVHGLVRDERKDRHLGTVVMAPIEPLCATSTFTSRPLPRTIVGRLWAALKQDEAALVDEAREAARKLRHDDEPPAVFDTLCRQAADRLSLRDGQAFSRLADAVEAEQAGAVLLVARSLRLAPIARAVLPRLPGWLRLMNDDGIAAIRVAYRDADTEGEDLAPAFTEMLAAHFEQPDQVLRLICAVMDRPSDRYLAASEMAHFGERLLSDLERFVDSIRRFDPATGVEGGAQLAADILKATHSFGEFEQWVSLGREGPWTTRLTALKRGMAVSVETRLRELPRAVETVLPSQQVRQGRAMAKGQPRLDQDIDPAAAEKARGLLSLLAESRKAAGFGGFGSTRNKTVEALDGLLNQYVEDLLDVLHTSADPAEIEQARVFLDVAAEFLGFVREPKAAEIVRRRAAAA